MEKCIMSRAAYEKTAIMSARADRIPPEIAHEIMAREYPKSTAEAIRELRYRGIEINVNLLNFHIKAGRVSKPPGGGRLKWLPSEIDAAAEVLCAAGRLTGFTRTLRELNLSHDQYLEAEADYFRRHFRGVPIGAALKVIVPGGETNRVVFAVDAAELAELLK